MNFGQDNQVVEYLFLVDQDEQHYIQEQLKQVGLNVMQARALNFIDQNPGAHQQDLAKQLGKQDASTTNILKVLEGRQLITRRLQPGNGRQKQLFLLPDGQALIVKVRSVFTNLEKRATTPLTKSEQATLLATLKKIHAELSKSNDD
ncbi:MarR family winged helix-turn-helix transcriptional regulator [Secundilactobacillus folii]|uniref:MarR family transcriptional regulator n=1 Tax=Secundilactobacillus folii TaxID=2678357 RepID=A0A7X3C3A6_9LACO|nr:MarR family winged helix-turn-helix transcriptional regulator [Secundilactobacillus folii]MTV82322.1 MarR family transcriptional regulator [Secundilactobacillus folii]